MFIFFNILLMCFLIVGLEIESCVVIFLFGRLCIIIFNMFICCGVKLNLFNFLLFDLMENLFFLGNQVRLLVRVKMVCENILGGLFFNMKLCFLVV